MIQIPFYAFPHIIKKDMGKDREMGKLIIDGTAVYEIDEECARKKKIPKECEVLDKLDPGWKNKKAKGRRTRHQEPEE